MSMAPIQWLLIGGPSDGVTVWIKQGGRVLSKGVTYDGTNYLFDGALYRIGFIDRDDVTADKVEPLIRSTRPRPLAGTP